MQPDLEHKGFLKKMEKQINNKQKLVPVFAKNPFKPAAKLMYGSKRYTNAIKFNSCKKYDNIIDQHIDQQSKQKNQLLQYEIKNPHTKIISRILKKLENNTFRNQEVITNIPTDFSYEIKHKKFIFPQDYSTIDNSIINNSRNSIKLPRLNKSVNLEKSFDDSQDSRISQLIHSCHQEKDTLENIDAILLSNHKKQRKHLIALKKYVNLLSLDF